MSVEVKMECVGDAASAEAADGEMSLLSQGTRPADSGRSVREGESLKETNDIPSEYSFPSLT